MDQKGSFCPKAASAAACRAACACCWDARTPRPVTSAVTAPPPAHDHTMDMVTHAHILSYSPCQFTFSPLVSCSSHSQSQIGAAELFHAEGKYSMFYRFFLLQSQPVGRLSVYLSSMDHVTSNDKRGRVQVKRLVDFYSFSIYRSQSSPHLCCAHIRFMKSATSGRHQNQGKPCLFHGTGQSK
jgi:hypothetical protein